MRHDVAMVRGLGKKPGLISCAQAIYRSTLKVCWGRLEDGPPLRRAF
jgi:hypothetical protein